MASLPTQPGGVPATTAASPPARRPLPPAPVPDVVVGSAEVAVHVVTRTAHVARVAMAVVAPVVGVAVRPLPRRLQPAELVRKAAARGAQRRLSAQDQAASLLDELVPLVLDSLLRRIRLTEVILDHVDLDQVVAAVDLEPAVARVDVEAVTNRVDLDALAQRLDVDKVIARLDLTALVLERVDLEAVVSAVLDRVDLPALAQEVIEAVDLPALVRDSTGTMASDSVRGARTQAIAADELVSRAVDRLRHRMRREHSEESDLPTPGPPG
jgi:hypothetical protein